MTRRQKPTYDVVTPLDVDYLDAFGEATDDDCAHWDRARAYGREVLERIDGHWDRAEYPLDLVARAGELDLLTDGLEVPVSSSVGAGDSFLAALVWALDGQHSLPEALRTAMAAGAAAVMAQGTGLCQPQVMQHLRGQVQIRDIQAP